MDVFSTLYAQFDVFSWFFLVAALQLSVQGGAEDGSSHMDMSNVLADQTFMSTILSSVCLLLCNAFLCYLFKALHHLNFNVHGHYLGVFPKQKTNLK